MNLLKLIKSVITISILVISVYLLTVGMEWTYFRTEILEELNKECADALAEDSLSDCEDGVLHEAIAMIVFGAIYIFIGGIFSILSSVWLFRIFFKPRDKS